MGIEAIGTGLKGLIDDITALKRVYAPNELPDSVNELPAAVIILGETEYHADFAGDYDFTLRVIVLLTKQDSPSAFNSIIDFIDPASASSILNKINTDQTLGGTCDTCKVVRNKGVGATAWGGIMYLSTEFEIAVWA